MKVFKLFIFSTLLMASPVLSQSLQHKIGQMIIVGVENDSYSKETLLQDIETRNLGGVILFGYNIQNPLQVQSYTSSLQAISPEPLFIAVDQEGGIVARLDETNGYEQTYSAETLGTVFDREDSTRATAQLMAHWLSEAGFTMNLAPVVDLRINPVSPAIGFLDRSFSADAETVADHASWFIDEFHQMDIATALKHFPGHGSADSDSHFGFTDISDTWQQAELEPFQILIEQGYNDPVMTGHLYKEDWDSEYPVSLSEYAIQAVLRDSLGFDGVVISDELFMRALSNNYGLEETIVTAINAGTDILLFNTNIWNDRPLVEYIINLVSERVADGTISPDTIDDSYRRILDLKADRMPVSAERLPGTGTKPVSFEIRNYPNPFNPATTISISLLTSANASVSIYNALGRKVQSVHSGPLQPGVHSFRFDGSRLSSGIYYVVVRSGSHLKTHPMTLIK